MIKHSKTLDQAIRDNNMNQIKASLIQEIKYDPTFSTNNFQDTLDYVRSKGIDVIEEYKKQIGENKLDKDKWDKGYFYMITNELGMNFAPKERLPHIKDVGKAVFEKKENENGQNNAQKDIKNPIAEIAGIIAAVIAIVGVIAFIIKLFK